MNHLFGYVLLLAKVPNGIFSKKKKKYNKSVKFKDEVKNQSQVNTNLMCVKIRKPNM